MRQIHPSDVSVPDQQVAYERLRSAAQLTVINILIYYFIYFNLFLYLFKYIYNN